MPTTRQPVVEEPDRSRNPNGGQGRESALIPAASRNSAMPVLSLLEPEQAMRDAALLGQWELSLSQVNPLNRIYASPEWFFHRWRVYRRDNRVAILRDGEGRVIGICPLDFFPVALHYGVKKWTFRTESFPSAVIMGGEPMLAPEPERYHALFDGLFDELEGYGCITFESTPLDGMAWRTLQGQGGSGRNYYAYDPTGEPRTWYYIELSREFDQYLQSLPSKSRTNIRNKARKFRKNSPGSIECQRVQTEDQVGHFYHSACQIAERSWRHRAFGREFGHPTLILDSLRDLARSGLLRAYLLSCGGEPLAYVVGYQLRGVFEYAESAYVEDRGSLGPGTFLLHSILEDLHQHDAPRLVNFGVGEGDLKRLFANRRSYDAGLHLFRRTAVNRLYTASHGAFRSALRLAKRYLMDRRDRRTPADPRASCGQDNEVAAAGVTPSSDSRS
jgi:hypothetical protein